MISTFWFTIGGIWDLRRMFKQLDEKESNVLDDGRVINNVSADDVALVEKIDHVKIEKAHCEEEFLRKELIEEHDDNDLENLNEHTKPKE